MAKDIYGCRFCVSNERMILYEVKKKCCTIWFAVTLICFGMLCFGLPFHATNMILFLKTCKLHGLWDLNIQRFSSNAYYAHCTCSHIHSRCILFFIYKSILLSILMITIASIVLQRSRHLNYQTLWLFMSIVVACWNGTRCH